jgi:hypothetical protein
MATGLIVFGALVTLAGVVWTLQGLGLLGGSFMTGATVWTIIGPMVAAIGVLLTMAGVRRR